MSVFTSPGWMTLAVTPVPGDLGGEVPGELVERDLGGAVGAVERPGGWSDAADVTFTMRPQPASSMPARNARTVRNGATASTMTVRTHSSGSHVRDERDGAEHARGVDEDRGAARACPRTSTPQPRDGGRIRDVGGDTRRPSPRPPCPSRSVSASWSALRATATTVAPRSASASAVARPRPRPPPVTTATRPCLVSHRLAPFPASVSRWNTSRTSVESTMPSASELHERVHQLAPPVMDRRVPQPVPGALVVDLRVEEQHRVVLEDGHLRDALALDLGDQLRPDLVVLACGTPPRPPGLRRIVKARRIMA